MRERRKPAGGRLVVVLYEPADARIVQPVIAELNKRGVETWDQRALRPGDNWQDAIFKALTDAGAIVMFISPATFPGKQVRGEYAEALHRAGAPVMPVLIAGANPASLPQYEFSTRPFMDLAHYPSAITAPEAAEAADVALKLAAFLGESFTARGLDRFEGFDRRGLARDLAEQSRGPKRRATDVEEEDKSPPTSLFVVHGHDDDFLAEVTAFVRKLNVEPIVMRDVGGASLSLVQKFMEMGRAAKYAVVLLSADDYGAGRFQFDEQGVAERALQFRARQNVILELGFFYGHLGFENVFVLEKGAPRVFPNFERPSDLNGVVFDRYDQTGKWRAELHRRLSSHGFQIPALEALAS